MWNDPRTLRLAWRCSSCESGDVRIFEHASVAITIETKKPHNGGETASDHQASQTRAASTRLQQILGNDESKGVPMLRQPTLSTQRHDMHPASTMIQEKADRGNLSIILSMGEHDTFLFTFQMVRA